MSDAQIEAKFLANATPVIGAERAQRAVAGAIDALEKQTDVRERSNYTPAQTTFTHARTGGHHLAQRLSPGWPSEDGDAPDHIGGFSVATSLSALPSLACVVIAYATRCVLAISMRLLRSKRFLRCRYSARLPSMMPRPA